ncbi:MAG: hypothetical protein HYZ92_00510 [Candidatus Omnitrophica bacterium]|nr:hypothetical protein [Candidatus Omnitrophota bacterium]
MMAGVAVELSEAAVRAVCLERRGSQIRLVACAEAPWSGTLDDLQAALGQLRRTLPIRQPVILGLPTTSAIVASVEPLVVRPQRAALAVQFELQQQLPYDVGQAVWHFQWREQTSSPQAVVAAAKRSLVDEYLQACRRSGLSVQTVSVSALGAVNLWQQQAGGGRSGLLLHLDGPLAQWVTITAAGLQVVPLRLPAGEPAQPSAGSGATPDPLIELLKSSWESVTELTSPRRSGGPPSGSGPSPIVGARSAGVLTETRTPLTLIGVAAADLSTALKRELGCEVQRLAVSGVVSVAGSLACDPDRSALACGLALQGLGGSAAAVNLLTEVQVQRRQRLVRLGAGFAAALGLLLSVASAGQGMRAALQLRQRALEQLTAQEQTYEKLRPEAKTVLLRQARLERRLRQLQDIVAGRTLVIQALQQAVEALPDEIWLTRVEFSKTDSLYGLLEGRSRSFPGVTRLTNQLRSAVGWNTVKPLGTTIKSDPESGAELIAFTIEVQQPLAKPEPEKSGTGKDEDS